MTQKALNFIVNGMLNNEREITEKRIAFILAKTNEKVVDGFTDGFINSVKVTNPEALFNYVKDYNKSKQLTKIVRAEPQFDGFDAYIHVDCKRIIYGKPDGKTWETADKADELHTIKQEVTYSENIPIYPDSQIPGVSFTIL